MASDLAIAGSPPAYIKAVEGLRAKQMTAAKKSITALLKTVAHVPNDAKAQMIASDRDKWIHTITSQYQNVGTLFSNLATTKLAQRAGLHDFDLKDKSYAAGVSAFLGKYSDQHVPTYVDLIVHSFEKNIKDAIEGKALSTTRTKAGPKGQGSAQTTPRDEDDEDDDEGTSDAGDLDSLVDGIFGTAAIMIAGSVVILASGLGGLAGANAFSGTTGVESVKIWQTVEDDHVRPDHEDADGQEVGLDEAFSVGSDQLMFPLDTSLGAGPDQTFGCRCVMGTDVTSTMRRALHLDTAEVHAAIIRANLHLVE